MKSLEFTRRETGLIAAGLSVLSMPLAVSAAENRLVVRMPQDIQVLDPANVATRSEINIAYALFNRLITFKPHSDSWEWQLDAAEHMEQIDPTHIAFRLKPGIMWTNGFGEMTAEDVKFSYERLLAFGDQATNAPDFADLDHVEVTDTYSGTLVLKAPSQVIWTYLPWVSGSIVSKAAIEAAGGGMFTTDPPAVSNAYQIAEWRPKERLVLERNPLWTGAPAVFDPTTVIPIDDDKSAEVAFAAGELDFTEISLSSIPVYREDPPEDGYLLVRPAVGVRWLGMNTEHPSLSDQRVRRAIQLGVDVERLLEGAYFGMAPRATGIVAPGVLGHRDRNLYPDRDVEQARTLLEEAGVAEGLQLQLTVENNTDMLSMAQLIQADLAEIGIDVEIDALESGLFWIQGIEAEGDDWKDLQLFIHNWGFLPDPSHASQWFVPEQVGNWNWERWESEEFGKLHEEALTEEDPAKRRELYVRMQDLMEESGAYLFISPGVNAFLVRDGVEPGMSPDGRRIFLQFFERT